MALAEDEEIGRSEKDSSLGENTATGKMQLYMHAEVKMTFCSHCLSIVHCVPHKVVNTKGVDYVHKYTTCAGLRLSAPPQ